MEKQHIYVILLVVSYLLLFEGMFSALIVSQICALILLIINISALSVNMQRNERPQAEIPDVAGHPFSFWRMNSLVLAFLAMLAQIGALFYIDAYVTKLPNLAYSAFSIVLIGMLSFRILMGDWKEEKKPGAKKELF